MTPVVALCGLRLPLQPFLCLARPSLLRSMHLYPQHLYSHDHPGRQFPILVFSSATGSHSRWRVRESRISREETQSDIVQSEWSTESANAPPLFLLTIGYGTVVPTHTTSRRKGSTETEEKMSQNAKVEVRPRQFDEKFRRASGDPSGLEPLS